MAVVFHTHHIPCLTCVEALLRTFDVEMGASSSNKQAPCKGYLDLVSMASMREEVAKVAEVESKTLLDDMKKNIREMRKPISTLVSTVNGLARELHKEIEKSLKDREKEASKEAC
eukprot:2611395-Amphidinium_carterae.4